MIEVAEGIPFTELTGMSVEKLYALKGEIVSRGIKAVADVNIPIFPKRRFQHGALSKDKLRQRLPEQETQLRSQFCRCMRKYFRDNVRKFGLKTCLSSSILASCSPKNQVQGV